MHSPHMVAQIVPRGEGLMAERAGGEAAVELHVVPEALRPFEAFATLDTGGGRHCRRRIVHDTPAS